MKFVVRLFSDRGRVCPRRKSGTARRTGRRRTIRSYASGTPIFYRPWAGWKTPRNSTRRPRPWLRATTRLPSKQPRRCARSAGRPIRKCITEEPWDFIRRSVFYRKYYCRPNSKVRFFYSCSQRTAGSLAMADLRVDFEREREREEENQFQKSFDKF